MVAKHAWGLALALCACQPAGEHYGTTERTGKDVTTFYVNNSDEPEYLDPALVTDAVSSTLCSDLFEGLVAKHPKDSHAVAGVATRYDQSDDNRIYHFHLRPEARWSDGQPVTAADFAWSWQRVLRAETGARNVTLLYPIKNGRLFHQGKLKVLTRDEPVGGATLPKGTALRVLAASPATAAREPFASAPAGEVTVTPAASATSEQAAVEIVRALGPIECNDEPDRVFEVRVNGKTGFLPGCALVPAKGADRALCERFDDLPTFRAGERRRAPEVALQGFVPLASLASDPSVLGVRAEGDHLLAVELEEPTPFFVELTSYVVYFPARRDLVERFTALGHPELWYRPENIISNGPYVLKEHKFRDELVFERNPHHYAHDQLKLHRIVLLEVSEYTTTLNLYRAGEIDYIGNSTSLPAAQMDTVETYKDFHRTLWLSTYWYEFNVDKKPVNDVRVRRALNLAIDKQLLVDKVAKADQAPATHFVPPFAGGGYTEAHEADVAAGKDPFVGPEVEHNPERARALLREAGYELTKEGDGWRAKGFPPLEILYNTAEGHRVLAVAIQDMWKRELGITASLRNEEWKVLLKNIRDGHFQVVRFGWIADYNHPHTWMDTFLSFSSNNHTRWASGEFDKLIARAAATRDRGESMRLYREAEALTVREMPRLPLYFYTRSVLVKPYVKGFWPNASNDHYMRWIWIDPDWRSHPDQNEPAYPPEELPAPGTIAP